MTKEEFKSVREKLKLSREEIAELLAMSGYSAVANIELGLRNPGKLTAKFLRYLNAMPKAQAKKIIEEFNEYDSN